MKKNRYLIATLLLLVSFSYAQAQIPFSTMTLYKDQYCDCCSEYARYLQQHHVEVTVVVHPNMGLVKQTLGTLGAPSCHTTTLSTENGKSYVIEGHVPLASIEKLLTEQPDIKGIALPGMPISSPGMGKAVANSLSIMAIEHSGAVTTQFNQE